MDLIVNNNHRVFINNNFGEWFAKKVENSSKLGFKVEDTNIQFRLNTLKSIHVHWLVEFYNHITFASGSPIIINDWKATGIFDAIKMSSAELPSLDPFQDISPLLVSSISLPTPNPQVVPNDLCINFINHQEDDSKYDNTQLTQLITLDILIVDVNDDIKLCQ